MQSTIIYRARRDALVAKIKENYPDKQGVVILFAAYEQARHSFWQESSFFYFTGINEPGAVLLIELDGSSTLYIPRPTADRSLWVADALSPDRAQAAALGIDQIAWLGEASAGYTASWLFSRESHGTILSHVVALVRAGKNLFVAASGHSGFVQQRFCFERWSAWYPELLAAALNCALYIAQLRRRKDAGELLLMQKAITITEAAQRCLPELLADGLSEADIMAQLAQDIYRHGASFSFPPIVASGARATILHYDANNGIMADGELVVVDCGASWAGYAADLSRTYPVSGRFTERQQMLYDYVVGAQEYIESIARPGMWLYNRDLPDRSLHHCAVSFFARYNLDQYFVHTIGHFLGLDVHDVGDSMQPLDEGDVITIEPGLYLREEGIGIRVEDNFVITSQSVRRLSADLPYRSQDITLSLGGLRRSCAI